MAHAYHDELGLPTVTVHPFNVFGPGQIGGGAIRAFIEAALAGRDLTVHGDGSQIRAWCYVDDMVSGVLPASSGPEAVGQAFNIGNPRSSVTIYDLAQRIKRLTGCPGEIVFEPLDYVDVELRIPNVEKARELLGWEREGRARRRPRTDDRVVPREPGTAIRLARPDVGRARSSPPSPRCSRAGCSRWGRSSPSSRRGSRGACEAPHAVAVSSGTAALHLAVLALGLGPATR